MAGFHWALKSDGVLLLGKSESLGAHADMFTATDRKNKFFKKSAGAHVPLGMVEPAHEHGFHGKPPFAETRPASTWKEKLTGCSGSAQVMPAWW